MVLNGGYLRRGFGSSGIDLSMAGEDSIEVKFRLFDGTDIGPSKYDPSTTVASLKEIILARWPQGGSFVIF